MNCRDDYKITLTQFVQWNPDFAACCDVMPETIKNYSDGHGYKLRGISILSRSHFPSQVPIILQLIHQPRYIQDSSWMHLGCIWDCTSVGELDWMPDIYCYFSYSGTRDEHWLRMEMPLYYVTTIFAILNFDWRVGWLVQRDGSYHWPYPPGISSGHFNFFLISF